MMTSPELVRRAPAGAVKGAQRSPKEPLQKSTDWDSPSSETGTVKRRPNSCCEKIQTVYQHVAETKTKTDSLRLRTKDGGDKKEKIIEHFESKLRPPNYLKNSTDFSKMERFKSKCSKVGDKISSKIESDGDYRYQKRALRTPETYKSATKKGNEENPPGNIYNGLCYTKGHGWKMNESDSSSDNSVKSSRINCGDGYRRRAERKPKVLGLAMPRDGSCNSFSDADSGFLSPVSPLEPVFWELAAVVEQDISVSPAALSHCDSIQMYVQIYTDWANHYLERARSRRRVTELGADCRDGVLLADLLEAVTTMKVPHVTRKPRNHTQMFDNVSACLTLLHNQSVGGLEHVTAGDICAGRLKSVLALFFALSRYKQATKQKVLNSTKAPAAPADMTPNRQLPSPYCKGPPTTAGAPSQGSAIPLPGSALPARRCPPDKVRPLPPTPGQHPGIPGLARQAGAPSASSSRSTSPLGGSCSLIPRGPHSTSSSRPNSITSPPISKIPASPYSSPPSQNGTLTSQNGGKHSMLDKLKLFNKEKTPERCKTQISKRTSSSSGFSSARSERSDSSLSLTESTTTLNLKAPMATKQKSNVELQPRDQKSFKSKLISSKGSKDAKGNSKLDKNIKVVDKSTTPKTLSKENISESKISTARFKTMQPIVDCDSKIKIPTSKPAVESRLKSSSQLRLNERPLSEYRNSLERNKTPSSLQQPKPIVQTQIGTGIPKPMAAVKGTTKILKEESVKIKEHVVKENTDATLHISNITPNAQNIAVITKDSQKQTLIVSPMPNKESAMTDSTHSASTGQNSNSSDSSVIYRPSSESEGDANKQNNPVIPNRKIERVNYIQDVISESDYAMNELKSQIQAHNQVLKPNDKHNKILNNQMKHLEHKGGVLKEEEEMSVKPMRPLLRGYGNHVTLPTRGNRSGNQIITEYCELDTLNGYMSDGDVLRGGSSISRGGHSDGYMSEGGTGLYRRGSQPTPHGYDHRSHVVAQAKMDPGGAPLVYRVVGGSKGVRKAEPEGSRRNSNDQWKKYTDVTLTGPVGTTPQAPPSPTGVRKSRSSGGGTPGSPGHSRKSHSGHHQGGSKQSNRVKGVPQSFGYVKRSNGVSQGSSSPQHSQGGVQSAPGTPGRTAQVSAVPRTKMKVSGGTQTCSADLQSKPTQAAAPPQVKSYSLTGPSASQLSQSVRERLAMGPLGSQSLPKPGSPEFQHMFQAHRAANRGGVKMSDGSLSDTQTYAEVKSDYGSPYASWLKHSNTYGASARLSECDSMESLAHRSSMNHGGKFSVHRDTHSPRLNRSNSIRSTKSEKLYPSMLHRSAESDCEPYYCLPVSGVYHHGGVAHHGGPGVPMGGPSAVPWSQPTSPTPQGGRASTVGVFGPLSPTSVRGYGKKNDEVHGSAASLLSGGSSLYGGAGGAEERHAGEVRRLKRELIDARDQVLSLNSQLSTNAHVVSAFEQSLSNMTQRLQQLTVTAERKDSELTEMRQTIELLRKQSIQAGLTSAHIRSMGVASPASTNGQGGVKPTSPHNPLDTTSSSRDSCMTRHHSTDSMSSLNSLSSNCSMQDKKKKKGWLRSSFTKAFSRNAKVSKTSRQVVTGADSALEGGHSDGQGLVQSTPPRSPQKVPHSPISAPLNNITESRTEGNGSSNEDQVSEEVQLVVDLKKQLREKDLVLTDIRLEALTSAHQLESLKDTVMKMRTEMLNLKQNNERLQRLVTSRSLAGSEVSLGGSIISVGDPRRCSMSDGGPARPPMDLPRNLSETDEDLLNQADPPEPAEGSRSSPESLERLSPREQPIPEEFTNNADNADATDGKKIAISVYLGQPESFLRYFEEVSGTYKRYITDNHLIESSLDNHFYKNQTVNYNEFVIAHTYISGKTTWQNLDYIVRKTFKDYLSKIDPGTNLGLNTDSITSYHLGEAKRGPEMGLPELLPCGYIIGNVKSLYICLQGVGSLAFDSLIPRSIVNRYISLLSEHRRLILCGPGGTGKSYLARRLAEFLVARAGHMHPNEAIATFNVDPKSSKELRQYLSHVAEQGMAGVADDLPAVIILDDLHHASALGEVFSCLLSAGPSRLPCIIGTMSQATCNTTNLQLHHNFRWVLTANHMEPVKGFLARYLRRRLFSLELQTGSPQGPLDAVLSWLPAVWTHVNRFLEAHSSSDVTIGPRLFLQCPLDLKSSQVWFTDVWNYSLAPYLVEAVREGVQLYGRRGGPWTDPSAFLRESYPWQGGPGGASPLRHVTAEDVGMEPGPGIQDSNGDSQDPLLSMLMRLQEAANYSNDSDCASLDSNLTHDSSAGAD